MTPIVLIAIIIAWFALSEMWDRWNRRKEVEWTARLEIARLEAGCRVKDKSEQE